MWEYNYYPTSDELHHHGILGQKWGKRNGPPYPLSESDHSAAEKAAKRAAKKAVRKADRKNINAGAISGATVALAGAAGAKAAFGVDAMITTGLGVVPAFLPASVAGLVTGAAVISGKVLADKAINKMSQKHQNKKDYKERSKQQNEKESESPRLSELSDSEKRSLARQLAKEDREQALLLDEKPKKESEVVAQYMSILTDPRNQNLRL